MSKLLNNRKRRPTHPGAILREDVLPGTGLTQGQFARLLGVSRRTVNEILQERRPVTTDMAHRLSRALGTSPEVWLGLQQDVDVWDALEANRKEYERIKRVPKMRAA
jgi:addiction module HigA family antidote